MFKEKLEIWIKNFKLWISTKPLEFWKNNKTPIIIVGVIAIALSYWIFSGSSGSENRKLRKEIKQIQKERDLIQDSLSNLRNDFQKAEDSLKIYYGNLSNIDKRLQSIESNINKSTSTLNETKKNVSDIRNDIKNKEKKPSNRVGDSLLKSLSKPDRLGVDIKQIKN